ncbi:MULTISPECIES: hypothetical protein [unclassified Streptomyces]|uniref:hypothetical protein n=1 Tax=unclassified Streptomyces TaxID=2593676 RepID=UPI000369F4F7|nr:MULTISPECIES: hypothetical protein [unclassified Streptomyces]
MAVDETVIALLRPKRDLAKLASDPAGVRAVVDGTAEQGERRLVLDRGPAAGVRVLITPGTGGAQADVVLTARQNGVPLLSLRSTTATRPRTTSRTSWRSTPASSLAR